MKFTIMMKTPDAVDYAIKEAIEDIESEEERETEEEKAKEITNKYFQYGECVNIEIDTETGTCKVLPK